MRFSCVYRTFDGEHSHGNPYVIILELINLGSVLSVPMGISNPILSIATFHVDIVVMDDRDDNNGDDAVTKSTLSS